MDFQYFSDLHLEFGSEYKQKIKPFAPYLVIAGDIGNICGDHRHKYEKFLEYVSKMFTYVFIITGNHEYYKICKYNKVNNKDWFNYVEQTIRDISSKWPNVIYLQNTYFKIPNTKICVYGSTLWSTIDDNYKYIISQQMNDYNMIPNFSTDKSTQLFRDSLQILIASMIKEKDYKFVIVTHHLPSYDLISNKYKGDIINSAFANNIDTKILNDPQILAWFCGHTHLPYELGKFHVNPIGYPFENACDDFNKVIHI